MLELYQSQQYIDCEFKAYNHKIFQDIRQKYDYNFSAFEPQETKEDYQNLDLLSS